ncbi:hypothetical protein BC835DRAFT_1279354 [Cytidiella melzeri]|nr:hypothetical protein BC835DRAFT_1279354 [Cytidiella melzeri]
MKNAFSEKLRKFGNNFYDLFVPDLLHEFELGVWKATFSHTLRILFAAGGDRIQQLNERFRQVPTFGRDTIRRFTKNTADMKKLAARDFEDILQCCIPVFEGLLDEPFNAILLDLLWTLAVWHALAKLRMQTSSTLAHLDNATTALGKRLRLFKDKVCDHFATRELPRESAARGRRTAALAAKGQMGIDTSSDIADVATILSGQHLKTFNLSTYKLHALGDYVSSIKQFGPSDNTSTQTVRKS